MEILILFFFFILSFPFFFFFSFLVPKAKRTSSNRCRESIIINKTSRMHLNVVVILGG